MNCKYTQWQYWILQNLKTLSKIYGRRTVVLDAQTWQSLLILNYSLPSNWKQTHSRLLIVLPQGPQVFYNPPERFYLDKGLRTCNGKTPAHYFEDKGYNDMSDRGMARFSFHLKEGWQPKAKYTGGTTILELLGVFHRGLSSAAEEAMR